MTPEEILLKAVDVIHERGWSKGDYEQPDGTVCTVGALNVAVSGYAQLRHVGRVHGVDYAAWTAARDRVARVVRVETGDIVVWNDHVARDADEVIDVLKRAVDVEDV